MKNRGPGNSRIRPGVKISELRKLKATSTRALAREAGIAHGRLLMIESGVIKHPPAEYLSKIAEALEIAMDELL